MKVAILGQEDAEKLCKSVNDMKIVMISISSLFIDNVPNVFIGKHNGIIDILKLKFNDTENPDVKYEGITQEQAILIANFVNKYKDRVDLLVVHCYLGKSRSAGVGAAILEYTSKSCESILNDDRYDVNMLVFRRVLKAIKTNIGPF